MYEVEAKVPLTSQEEISRVSGEIEKIAVFQGEYLKKDIYFTDSGPVTVRLREENGKGIFCIKQKTLIGQIESNQEIEWKLKDGEEWEKILKGIGLIPKVRKIKTTRSYQSRGFTIELNHVEKLGMFLEIEKLVPKKSDIPQAKKELIDLFKRLGYSQKAFEKRYYLELLNEQKNDQSV